MGLLVISQFGDPVLRRKAKLVSRRMMKALSFRAFLGRMLAAMRSEGGIGLAAPQAGRSLQAFVVELGPTDFRPELTSQPALVFFNPRIVSFSREVKEDWEGCLSLPGIFGLVPRSLTIKMRYDDRDGRSLTENFEGLLARVCQHEVDHLNGVLFVDRMKNMSSLTTSREFERYVLKKKMR